MNRYRIVLELDEKMYRLLQKAEVKLKFKGGRKHLFIPYSKRQMKYRVEKTLYQK